MANEVRTAVQNALAVNNIDYVHWECHKGAMWYLTNVINSFTSNLVEKRILLLTPSSKEVHWRGYFATNGPCQYRIYEDPYVAPNSEGTVIPNYNFNRNFSSESSQSIFYENPSTYIVASLGIPIFYGRIVGSTGGTLGQSVGSVGGEARSSTEFVFKPNSNYLFYFKNTAGVSIIASFECEYYEED